MEKSVIFLDRFHSIETMLRQQLRQEEHISFSYLVEQAAKQNSLIRQKAERLKSFGRLRNAIQHGSGLNGEAIAEPHDKIVEEIIDIEEKLRSPKRMNHFFREVYSLTGTDSMSKMLHLVHEFQYSQFPVFNSEGEFISLVTESGITNWLASNVKDDLISFEETRVSDLLSVDELAETYRFISRITTVYEAKDYFLQAANEGRKLEALLITESGKSNQSLLGILTHWDLAKFD
ncbi:CBS domain-containing protein [Exiguobacterium profundum]|uniref:CBS domain-containing protein n=1 Tax=Exiguobacterium profundum TaxID=307643 RepID=A0ABY8AYJ1_9BACL|nr:CBS domain-containing protein [Exiguobacterium profundum]WED54956.1 CBS domain-containing protein [Exiguobacterium profundum]